MAPGPRYDAPGWRRALQLALAALWLLDALLQYQSFMFSQGFPRMLAATAAGNPRAVAGPVTWSAHLIGTHPGAATAVFGTGQLLLALGIAWRPTVRAALAVSIAWALAIWWLGEGLGGLFAGTASPVTGAPGAALLYALAAVLLWPAQHGEARAAPHAGALPDGRDGADGGRQALAATAPAGGPAARTVWRTPGLAEHAGGHGTPFAAAAAVGEPTARAPRRAPRQAEHAAGHGAPFAAAAAVGGPAARAVWLVLWGGLAWLAVTASRGTGLLPGPGRAAPSGPMPSGDPRWLRSLDAAASGLAGQHAAVAGLAVAAMFAIIAVGVYLPAPMLRAVLCLAALAALAMWAAGQDLGGLFTRTTTDPGTAPLLILLAAAYWPVPRIAVAADRARAAAGGLGSPEARPLAGVS